MKHIAVVPVFDGDARTAVDHASNVAPEVIAIAFNGNCPSVGVPLVSITTLDRSWNQSVEHVIGVLKRNNYADRVTLVVPRSLAAVFAAADVDVVAV